MKPCEHAKHNDGCAICHIARSLDEMPLTLDEMLFDVASFHDVISHPERPFERLELRFRLMQEEMKETLLATRRLAQCVDKDKNRHRAELLDGVIDTFYVLIGTVLALGMEKSLETAWQRVHRANMAKFPGGKIILKDGKVMKPEGWTPPDLSDLV